MHFAQARAISCVDLISGHCLHFLDMQSVLKVLQEARHESGRLYCYQPPLAFPGPMEQPFLITASDWPPGCIHFCLVFEIFDFHVLVL